MTVSVKTAPKSVWAFDYSNGCQPARNTEAGLAG